jgi:gluconokinase
MILVIMGVSGSGKTTIGQQLAAELGWSFYDGDDFHPATNVEKMSQGIALTDEDRTSWLSALSRLIGDLNTGGKSGILACSALKHTYRETLRQNASDIKFVYLKGSYDLILKRLKARKNHYMRPELLQSQFDAMEEPGHALIINVEQSPGTIVRQIRQALAL